MTGHLFDDESPQRCRVSDGDVEDKVVCSSDKEELIYLVQGSNMLRERFDVSLSGTCS